MAVITKALIDKMLEMPDDRLLTMLKIVLSGSGIETSGNGMRKIDEKTMRRVRRVLAEITDDDIGRITRLTEVYKHGE